jgi:alpha-glucosidase
MRTHTTLGTPDQEPWSYGTTHEAINRAAIELRYQLLPEIYNVVAESATTGWPAMRPLVLEYPDDSRTWGLDDEFMLGRDLLLAPVLQEAQRERDVYLPKGEWFDFWTGRRYEGGKGALIPVTLESIPIFVRSGAFVFRQPVVQHTGEMPGRPLEVQVFSAVASDAALYEDDGETMAYAQGAFMRRRFTQSRSTTMASIDVAAPEGSFRPAARDLVLSVQWSGDVSRVTSGSTTLTRFSAQELATHPSGWAVSDTGFVIVKQPDPFTALRVTIEARR